MQSSYTPLAVSPLLPGQVATRGGGPESWPKKTARHGPHRKVDLAGEPGGEEGGGKQSPLPRSWIGSPKTLFRTKKCPQTSGHRARQDRTGQTWGTAWGQGSPMTAVFSCRFPSCSGREAAQGDGGGEKGGEKRRREVNRRPQREPVPGVQRTLAASGPRWVAVCVEMKLGGGGREGSAGTHFSAVIHLASPDPPAHSPPG